MGINHIIEILNQNYNLHIKNIELFREGGNLAYVVYGEDNKFFLKIIRPPFIENALYPIDIQLYLMKNQFPVIPIVLAKMMLLMLKLISMMKERFLYYMSI